MSEVPQNGFVGFIRKLLPWTSVVVVLVALYVGWIMLSRWQQDREYERRQAAQRAATAERARTTFGDELKILSFTLSTSTIRRGQSAQLCYGVANAKSVRFEPPVEHVWPSMSRCVDVSPRKDTTYKLIAEDAAGHRETAELKLFVVR